VNRGKVRTVIILQGGGALGAYECGVLEALYQARGKDFTPEVILRRQRCQDHPALDRVAFVRVFEEPRLPSGAVTYHDLASPDGGGSRSLTERAVRLARGAVQETARCTRSQAALPRWQDAALCLEGAWVAASLGHDDRGNFQNRDGAASWSEPHTADGLAGCRRKPPRSMHQSAISCDDEIALRLLCGAWRHRGRQAIMTGRPRMPNLRHPSGPPCDPAAERGSRR